MKNLFNKLKSLLDFAKEGNYMSYPKSEALEISIMERAMMGGF